MRKTEVLIIGGGIPGLTLALLLARAGMETVIVDTEKVIPLSEVEATGRTSALMNSSIKVLKRAEIWPLIADKCEALKTLTIIDDSHKNMDPLQVDFHAREISLDAFGYNTPNTLLRAALIDTMDKLDTVIHIAPARLKQYTTEGAHITATLDNNETIKARVIIGADGRNSVTRECAGIDISKRDYGQSAITCLITHSKPHNGQSIEFHRPGGPFTTVPMPGNESAIVWMDKTEDVDHIIAMDKRSFTQSLQDKTRGMLGEVSLSSTPQSWPIITLKAKQLTAPRTALMAEAAHVLSPIGAQGLNLSFRDVDALSETLIEGARLGQDVGSETVLNTYAKKRKIDIGARVFGIDSFNRIVGNNIDALRRIRRLGLKTFEQSSILRQIAMQEGLAK